MVALLGRAIAIHMTKLCDEDQTDLVTKKRGAFSFSLSLQQFAMPTTTRYQNVLLTPT